MEIKIAELISTDIRSRANVNIIRSEIDGLKGEVKLDFKDVTFISRSFADELYNLVSECKNVSLENMAGIVQSMYGTVKEARKSKSKRVFNESDSEMKVFNDMESLSSYLATI